MTARHLDGNALGGLMFDFFGRDMTEELAACGACGSVGPMGRALAFVDAPGKVLRCFNCEAVLLVAVTMPAGVRVTIESLRWIEFHGE